MPGFSLVEVIVAVGIVAVTITSLTALLTVAGRSAGENSARTRAVNLADPLRLELGRLRDLSTSDGSGLKLDALAAIIPPAESGESLRLVGSADGMCVVREEDADASAHALPRSDRYFLIEVRRQAGQLAYFEGAGFLAVSATVRWPYLLPDGTGGSGYVQAEPSRTSPVVINGVVGP